ncbi:cation:proton antiporter [Thermochromatium tepidum]|uniref:Sodium:proton exchanger n=1 Tax=Thermochromatium tepidum ATCC 43061 TaxID=316276 RepID=A0A6I6E8Z4_THETI|nr:cation:proton antiporter [Thermochromatium tepidum]QGU33133.1 sodium:proton exchanger [Thermochromatium tepidum ATCC 43061]
MSDQSLTHLLLLLGSATALVWGFQRLQAPPVLGYLLVGVLLGPHTPGLVIEGDQLRSLSEYGIVFLLFTIGLNFSLPQLRALRHTVLWLGTTQVVLTTALVAVPAWLLGLSPVAAFVVGAVFAQSSTTILGKLLEEQREEQSRHGRLGLAMSVFQDVTAVPFVVIIPVLGLASGIEPVARALGWAMVKAALALALVYIAGRWLLRPLFHLIVARRSTELFTLTVLFVSLTAAWITGGLGLSMAFGGFLVGMMLGETEFRHQIEAAIRPFRDVLVGLFFVGIGMLFDPWALPEVWHLALGGALSLLVLKALVVAPIVRLSGADAPTSWRVALLLAVGGEFGFALLAIALESGAIAGRAEQVALMSVLLSMVIAPFLIRHNGAIARRLARSDAIEGLGESQSPLSIADLRDHVIICGYGRVGHTVATLLHASAVPFVAFDTDLKRVARGREDGYAVFYGDVADVGLFAAAHGERAALVVVTIDQPDTAWRTVSYLRQHYPHLPIIARARDLEQSARLMAAGATRTYPEAIEASLRLGAMALSLVGAAPDNVDLLIQDVRDSDYRLVSEDQGARQPSV